MNNHSKPWRMSRLSFQGKSEKLRSGLQERGSSSFPSCFFTGPHARTQGHGAELQCRARTSNSPRVYFHGLASPNQMQAIHGTPGMRSGFELAEAAQSSFSMHHRLVLHLSTDSSPCSEMASPCCSKDSSSFGTSPFH